MSWTGRSDAEPCCEGARGAVAADERVARITIRPARPQGYQPFSRRDLFPPADGQFSNDCGMADGLSVDRANGLSEAEIVARSAARAATANARREAEGKPPSQSQDGAIIAHAGHLRALRRDQRPDQQMVFVYDDPTPTNDRHAVIRCSVEVPDEVRASFLARMQSLFDTVVSTRTDG